MKGCVNNILFTKLKEKVKYVLSENNTIYLSDDRRNLSIIVLDSLGDLVAYIRGGCTEHDVVAVPFEGDIKNYILFYLSNFERIVELKASIWRVNRDEGTISPMTLGLSLSFLTDVFENPRFFAQINSFWSGALWNHEWRGL